MIFSKPVSYKAMSASGIVKPTKGETYGFIVVASTAGIVQIYDSATGPTGPLLYDSVTALTAGATVTFGGNGVLALNGIYLQLVSGTATVNALYV